MTSRTLKGFLLLMLAAGTAGCDGARTGPSAPSPITRGPIAPDPSSDGLTVSAASNGVAGFYRLDVTMSRSGTATVSLRWPNGDYSLQLYVTSGACADTTSLVAGGCTVLGKTRPGDLPGVVTSPVTDGDRDTIWVLNSDPYPQSFTVDVGIQ